MGRKRRSDFGAKKPLHPPKSDLCGMVFSRLTAIADTGDSNKSSGHIWLCRCICGNERMVPRHTLISGGVTSCGCKPRGVAPKEKPTKEMVPRYQPDGFCCIKGCSETLWGHDFCRSHYGAWRNNGHPLFFHKAAPKRGKAAIAGTKEYRMWCGMRARCENLKNASFGAYGGRGISVCESWKKFDGFFADMGKAPTPKHSLDRVDVNGNYEPSNCRWATITEQNRNTRSTVLTAEIVAVAKLRRSSGEKIKTLATEFGVSYYALVQALAGASWADVAPAGRA